VQKTCSEENLAPGKNPGLKLITGRHHFENLKMKLKLKNKHYPDRLGRDLTLDLSNKTSSRAFQYLETVPLQ
jgi:hypothetical protein